MIKMPILPKSPKQSSAHPQHYASESDISNLPDTNEPLSSNVSKRMKRSRNSSEEDSYCLKSFKSEILQMLQELKSDQNTSMNNLLKEIAEVKQQNTMIQKSNEEIEQSISFLSNKYEDMKNTIDCLEKERKLNTTIIQSLEDKIEDIQRNLKSTSLEIRNVPMPSSESKKDLIKTVQDICKVTNSDLLYSEIKDAYRVSTKTTKNTIIVELTSNITKNDILKKVKAYNKNYPKQKLNSSHLGLMGKPVPIYLSENLTQKTKRLFFLARDMAKTFEYKYCWTSNGRVYLRKSDEAPHVLVKDENILESLKSIK